MSMENGLSKREQISSSLSSISMGLLVVGVLFFGAAYLAAQHAGSIYDRRNWGLLHVLAVWLLVLSFAVALASLIKPNPVAIMVLAGSFFFEFWSLGYFLHLIN